MRNSQCQATARGPLGGRRLSPRTECDDRELAVHVDDHGYYREPDQLKSRPRLHAIAIRPGGLAWIFDPELNLYWAGKRQG